MKQQSIYKRKGLKECALLPVLEIKDQLSEKQQSHIISMEKMELKRRTDHEAEKSKNQEKQRTESDTDSLSASKKRDRELADDEIVLCPEVLAKMSRSERKRHREKKRRSDVNKGFDDLMNLLLEIDPAVRAEAEDRARRGQWKGNLGAQEENLLSRVELIGRTVEVLGRVHKENEQRKTIIEQLLRQKTTLGMPSVLNLPNVGLAAQQRTVASSQQHFAGLGSLPNLRPAEQSSNLPSSVIGPLYQQQIGGATISTFPPGDFLGFANAQIQTFPRFVPASSPLAQGPSPANLMDQFVAERDAAAVLARARSKRPGQETGPPRFP